MARELRALRGATTLQSDTPENMGERLGELLNQLVTENNVKAEDIVNIFFAATPDISSAFPASAARSACAWLDNVVLFGSQELKVETDQPLCVRILLQFYVKGKPELKHLYLHGAKELRKDNSPKS